MSTHGINRFNHSLQPTNATNLMGSLENHVYLTQKTGINKWSLNEYEYEIIALHFGFVFGCCFFEWGLAVVFGDIPPGN